MIPTPIRWVLLSCAAILLVQPAVAETWEQSYDPSLGTLPSAQGWTHSFSDPAPDDGLDESNYTVAAGVLTQGPTGGTNDDDANYQWYEVGPHDWDFEHDVIEIDLRLKILTSTISTGTSNERAGFGVQISDRDQRLLTLYIGESELFLQGPPGAAATIVPYTATGTFTEYTLQIDAAGASLWVQPQWNEPYQIAYLQLADFGAISLGSKGRLRFGDLTSLGRSSSEIEWLRYRRRAPAPVEARSLEYVTLTTAASTSANKFISVDCPAGKKVVGGGATVTPADEGLIISSTPQIGTQGWRADAAGSTVTPWQLRVDAVCAEVPGFTWHSWTENAGSASTAQAACPQGKTLVSSGGDAGYITLTQLNYLKEAAPFIESTLVTPMFPWSEALTAWSGCSDVAGWHVVTNTTSSDTTTEKSIEATCPTGQHPIGGGARVVGDAVAGLSKSSPALLFGNSLGSWIATAEDVGTMETPAGTEAWRLEATAICTPVADAQATRHELVGRWNADLGLPIDEQGVNDAFLQSGASIEPGLAGEAFSFERTNLEWAAIAGEDFYPDASFTVDAWIQTDSLVAGDLTHIASLFDYGGPHAGGTNASYWALWLTEDGYAYGAMRTPLGWQFLASVTGSVDLADGQPHHLALVRDVSTPGQFRLHLYVDGEHVGFDQLTLNAEEGPMYPGNPGAPDPVTIGAIRDSDGTGTNRHFDGLIDDVKFWNRALSAQEIADIAGCGVAPLPRVVNVDAERYGGPTTAPDVEKLCVWLDAGAYELELVSPAQDADALFTGWSPGSGDAWDTAWSAIGAVDPGTSGGIAVGETSAQAAFDATTTKTEMLLVTQPQRVYFGVEDPQVLDNRGGVSIRVPEPRAEVGFVAGLLGLAGLARRRGRGCARSTSAGC